jgi:hypothetical protein
MKPETKDKPDPILDIIPPKYDPDWDWKGIETKFPDGGLRCIHLELRHRGDHYYQKFIQCEKQAVRFFVAKDMASIPPVQSFCLEHKQDTLVRALEYVEYTEDEMIAYEIMMS